jgi:hypothetical protein
MKHIISIDPGYGNFKAARIMPEGPEVAIRLSVVGVGETDLGMLSLGTLGRRSKQRPDEVTIGESESAITYLVGQNVARYARPVQRMDLLRLSDAPELRALFYDTIFHLLGEGDHSLSIMVGLPIEIMGDRKAGRDTLKALRSWMADRHAFSVNGSKMNVEIADIRAMAQPAGAFFAWGLDNAGKWLRDKADLQAPVAICDIGFNTLDLFAVEGGDVVARYTGGEMMGMRRAAEIVLTTLKARHNVEISLYEADVLIREKRFSIQTADGPINLTPLIIQALDTTAANATTFIEQRWGNARQFAHVLFTGGGTEMLKDALLQQYPHAVILPDPVTANALGLARYAIRIYQSS